MSRILADFVRRFESSFTPPPPYRGKSGSSWLISGVWSRCMRDWLSSNYDEVQCELPLPRRRRLDAALWSEKQNGVARNVPMDIALEWEWDNNKVALDFVRGDFRKLLEVPARCGVAIVHTRTDGRRGPTQAIETLNRLQRCWQRYRRNDRPIGVIEVRRVLQTTDRVEFTCEFHDLNDGGRRELRGWSFP